MTDQSHILRALYYATGLSVTLYSVVQVGASWTTTGAVLLILVASLMHAGLGLRVQDVRRSNGGASKSMHAAVATMLMLLVGPWIAVVAGVIASVTYDTMRRRKLARVVGNIPTRIVPIFAGGITWMLLGGGQFGSMQIPGDYLPLLGAAMVFAVVNEACFIWDALSAQDLVRARWRDEMDRIPSNLANTVLECLVGAGVSAICQINIWSAPVIVPLAASMYLALKRGNRIQQVTDLALETFANIVDERDRYTFEHSDRVCEYAMSIGRELSLTERQLEALYWTSRLHDLGKVAVDNTILNKPGKLTPDEFEVMKQHPEVSARILQSFSFEDHDADIVRCHHERYDGQGYLNRSRDDVPFEAFIIAVADAFDAMTTARPYRSAMSFDDAFQEIVRGVGTHFHPEPAYAFLRLMGYDLESELERLADEVAEKTPSMIREYVKAHPPDYGDDFRDISDAADQEAA